jgi:hypothetical protein
VAVASLQPARASATAPSPESCDQPPVVDPRGDARPFDIVEHRLTSDCSTWTFTTRLARPFTRSQFNVWELDMNIDGKPSGCQGADRIVLAFVDRGVLTAHLLATPRCDPATWLAMGTAPVTRPDSRSLQVTFGSRLISHAHTFEWWAAIDATGEGRFDVAPNTGSAKAYVPPPAPPHLTPRIVGTSVALEWKAPGGWNTVPLIYDVVVRRLDRTDIADRTLRTRERGIRLGRLARGTYSVSVSASSGPKIGQPSRTTVVIPQLGDTP